MTKELELTPAPAKRSRDEAIALKHLTRQRNRALAALKKIVEMNRQTAKDQYGDADKFESAAFICWCVCRDEEKRCKQ